MRLFRLFAIANVLLLSVVPSASASHVRRGPTSGRHKSTKLSASPKPRAMDDARATQIQNALVKAGYLQEASGHWDAASGAAMQKLQADNGWQTKMIPDSRALIKLGLGPNTQTSSAISGTSPSNGGQ